MDNSTIFTVTVSLVLGIITVLTIVGNVFVIGAIILERNLRTTGNYLVFSLAVADLMVACLVMPFGAFSEIAQQWTLGTFLCDLYTVADVLCCTASILHLLAIALDRYWAVTNVEYIHKRTPQRILVMIFTVWTVAAIVSIAPLFGWKDPDFNTRVVQEKRCLISQDISYQVFATISTFYGPLIFILLLYWKIYQVARKRIRHKPGKSVTPAFKANAKNIDLQNEKTLTGKRRLLVPSKIKFKPVKDHHIDHVSNQSNEKHNTSNKNGQHYLVGPIDNEDNVFTVSNSATSRNRNKAAVIMGIQLATIKSVDAPSRQQLAHYLANYSSETSPDRQASCKHTRTVKSDNWQNLDNSGNTATTLTTLDPNQLLASTPELTDNGSRNNDQQQQHNRHNTKANRNNVFVEANLDNATSTIASPRLCFANRSMPVNSHDDDNVEVPVIECYNYQKPCSSSPSKAVSSSRSVASGTSSASDSSPVGVMPQCKPYTINADSYQTTSSPASTSSNRHLHAPHSHNASQKKTIKESIESKRERKAAKILAIITGIFVICWLPFFVNALLMPLCKICEPSKLVFSIFLWLGYLNSLLNPIIYTIFSPDFRNGFRRILCGRQR